MKNFSFPEIFLERTKIFVGAILLLAVAGFFAAPSERIAWDGVRERAGTISVASAASSAGTGIALGTLGGFRTVFADIAWLRAFHFWTQRDAVSCRKYCELAMTLAPEQRFFTENTLSYIAYDFPVWEISRRGGSRRVPAAVRREIHKRAMADALGILENEVKRSGGYPHLFVIGAQIAMLKTEAIFGVPDFSKTAAYYRRACDFPDAPWFAFSSYASLVARHVPAERAVAENFLKNRRAAARSTQEKQLFDDLLHEFFPRK